MDSIVFCWAYFRIARSLEIIILLLFHIYLLDFPDINISFCVLAYLLTLLKTTPGSEVHFLLLLLFLLFSFIATSQQYNVFRGHLVSHKLLWQYTEVLSQHIYKIFCDFICLNVDWLCYKLSLTSMICYSSVSPNTQ